MKKKSFSHNLKYGNKGKIAMDQRRRMKLCPHCEGDVDLDVIVCPFCGKDVSEQKMTSHMQMPTSARNSLVRSLSVDETLNSLYPPPYRPKVYDQEIPAATTREELSIEDEEEIDNMDSQIDEDSEKKTSIVPILLFSLGINLCLFGLFLFFFSSNGEVWLHWKGGMWIAYLLLSAPFLYFGYKKIN